MSQIKTWMSSGRYKNFHKMRDAEIRKMWSDRPALYSVIYGQLSAGSLQKIKEFVPRERPVPEPIEGEEAEAPAHLGIFTIEELDKVEHRFYTSFHLRKDPKHLWEAIEATHSVAATGYVGTPQRICKAESKKR